MPLLLRISLILLFALAIKYLHSLLTNYLSARATGLKIIVSPLDPYGSICQILRALCDPFMRRFRWYRVIEPTCSFRDGDRWHRVLGSSFVVVSASRCIIYTNDPVAIEGNLRGKDIVKPKLYENLDIYGKNVDTVNGDEWARHRKLTAPCFNERISDIVWEETMRQVESMVSHWYSQPGNKTNTIVKDVRIMALHVLFSAGFGVSHDFHTGARVVASGREMSHATSLRTILQNIMTSVIVSQVSWLDSGAVKPMLSERVRKVLVAFKEFGQYMDEMIANERVLMAGRPESAKPNLISTMIQMSDKAKEQKAEGDQLTPKLTDEEIKGNLFIFNLAGHDTSSNTLVFAIALLSIHQDVQQWVMEELNEVLGTEETLAYVKVYPRLRRVTALMYETLRRYGPVITQPRAPRVPGTTIRITDPNEPSNTKTITIPPNTEVAHNFHACHTSATNFDDPLTFNPKRWIRPASSLADEKIVSPGRGFYAWSFGPRICLGMKFSQVEFAAAIVVMLKNFRLYPSSKMDMDEAMAREELNEILGRSVSGVTLGLEKPEEMYIRLAKR